VVEATSQASTSPHRHGVKTTAPQSEGWDVVAGMTDLSGVLWRFAQISTSDSD
jgi:hypothetical protein